MQTLTHQCRCGRRARQSSPWERGAPQQFSPSCAMLDQRHKRMSILLHACLSTAGVARRRSQRSAAASPRRTNPHALSAVARGATTPRCVRVHAEQTLTLAYDQPPERSRALRTLSGSCLPGLGPDTGANPAIPSPSRSRPCWSDHIPPSAVAARRPRPCAAQHRVSSGTRAGRHWQGAQGARHRTAARPEPGHAPSRPQRRAGGCARVMMKRVWVPSQRQVQMSWAPCAPPAQRAAARTPPGRRRGLELRGSKSQRVGGNIARSGNGAPARAHRAPDLKARESWRAPSPRCSRWTQRGQGSTPSPPSI